MHHDHNDHDEHTRFLEPVAGPDTASAGTGGRRRATGAGGRRGRRGGRRLGLGPMVAGALALAAVGGGAYAVSGTGGSDDESPAAASVRDASDGVPAAGRPSATATVPSKPSPTASATRKATKKPKKPSGKPSKKPSTSAPATPSPSAAAPTAARTRDTTRGGTGGSGSPGTSQRKKKTPAPRPTSSSRPPAGKAARYVQRIVTLANAERAKAGCSPLRVNSRVQAAAQAHADDMAARNYYDHTSPDGSSAGDRMKRAGYRPGAWGENIHKSPKDPDTAMRDWMKSPGHRANILNCGYKDFGVGVNLSGNGPWWVQNFATKL
ncbi:CAP domain-containing protein [Streptomyces sp. SAJ15]|uniref:CAP domain-containing protein n=1 Tax=Streptomyces sp. SAJ15 TaxID=2011095 RepID=UPI001185A696|nr:CAP domain-containing protein [Streptomyces sp. SAJ15]